MKIENNAVNGLEVVVNILVLKGLGGEEFDAYLTACNQWALDNNPDFFTTMPYSVIEKRVELIIEDGLHKASDVAKMEPEVKFKHYASIDLNGQRCYVMDYLRTGADEFAYLQIIGNPQVVRNLSRYIKKHKEESFIDAEVCRMSYTDGRVAYYGVMPNAIGSEMVVYDNLMTSTLVSGQAVNEGFNSRIFNVNLDDFECFNRLLASYPLPIPNETRFRKLLFEFMKEKNLVMIKESEAKMVKLVYFPNAKSLNDREFLGMRKIVEHLYANQDELYSILDIA